MSIYSPTRNIFIKDRVFISLCVFVLKTVFIIILVLITTYFYIMSTQQYYITNNMKKLDHGIKFNLKYNVVDHKNTILGKLEQCIKTEFQ